MSEHVDTPQLQPPNRPLSLALWNFTSQWFLVPQGTGILAVILARLDYQFNGLQILAKIVWIYTIVLFGMSLIIYLLRVHIYPEHALHELRTNLIETSCLSTETEPDWQSTSSGGQTPHWQPSQPSESPTSNSRSKHPASSVSPPAVLLPFIAIITSAAGAGVISRQSHVSPRLQVPAIIVAYLQLGLGLAVAASYAVLVMFQHFNQVHSVAEKVFQDMILCGPFGQGAFALQVLGEAVQESFGAYHRGTFLTAKAADTIGVTSQFLGLLTWGYGVFWWCFAILSMCHTLGAQPRGGRKPPFSLAAWSIIFPWGVFTNAAVELGKIMDSPAFAVVSTGLLLIMLVMWIVNQVLTLRGILTGRILGVEHWRKREESLDSFRSGDKDA
ncbi:C4-dicarboxylate transporter/malic acid transport protein [Penicillium verhagenii]|nr:C4-dicarboxylate transporter/malic acid transport protein [Penicillium verhagenii]